MDKRSFRNLRIWQLGKEITIEVYKLTTSYPRNEQFGLVSQLRRAAVSIPSNIAEGFNKFNNNEYRRYLYISLGSCAEIETQIEISGDLGFLSKENVSKMLGMVEYESKMIMTLIKKIELTRNKKSFTRN